MKCNLCNKEFWAVDSKERNKQGVYGACFQSAWLTSV